MSKKRKRAAPLAKAAPLAGRRPKQQKRAAPAEPPPAEAAEARNAKLLQAAGIPEPPPLELQDVGEAPPPAPWNIEDVPLGAGGAGLDEEEDLLSLLADFPGLDEHEQVVGEAVS